MAGGVRVHDGHDEYVEVRAGTKNGARAFQGGGKALTVQYASPFCEGGQPCSRASRLGWLGGPGIGGAGARGWSGVLR